MAAIAPVEPALRAPATNGYLETMRQHFAAELRDLWAEYERRFPESCGNRLPQHTGRCRYDETMDRQFAAELRDLWAEYERRFPESNDEGR